MIRPATLDDVPRLVEMGRAFLRTPPYAGLFADAPEVLETLIQTLIAGDATTVLVVAQGDGLVVGAIGLLVAPHFASGDLLASEVFWYMDPAHRGAGVRLLRAAERWAVAFGAVGVSMVAPNDRLGAVYERWGYQLLERSYLRRFDAA